MEVHATIQAFRQARRRLKGDLGLVPTMGYLHEGHLSLIRAAESANDYVAATIFVNPTQFGANEDLSSYPRDMDRDLALLQAEGVGLVFT
ncbi:MAG: pantoate--beta-alanine ligase, partial [Chloroflexi bacterium]|nr:pantoate--beta-alanine ligase [Chloroflexota bacterium]